MTVLRVALTVVALLAIHVTAAVAAPGDPPATLNLTPTAGSMYRAQFALCSLDTLASAGHKFGVNVAKLTDARAAKRIAAVREQSVGSAAVDGCSAGLLYRNRTDNTISTLRDSFRDRVSAEKYVAAVYLLIVFTFFVYVLILATKLKRLRREVLVLSDLVDDDGALLATDI